MNINARILTKGIAIGNAYIIKTQENAIEIRNNCDPDIELGRLSKANILTGKELKEIRDNCREKLSEEESAIFDMHIMLLSDPILHAEIVELVTEKWINVEAAIKEITDKYIELFEANSDEYFRARANDIIDVRDRILSHLSNTDNNIRIENPDTILVAKELTPSQTILLNSGKIKAVLLENGSDTSHSAIILKGLGIPTLIGVKDITSILKDEQKVIVDAIGGSALIEPDEEDIARFSAIRDIISLESCASEDFIHKKTLTKDGSHVDLLANIGSANETITSAEGIGLFRTEFLYMAKDREPSEDEQYEVYSQVLKKNNDKTVVIRTLDIGGDKQIPYLHLPLEDNPFLGQRAIRLCFEREDLFRRQLRALIRAGENGNLAIMFPMISNISELRKAKEIFSEEKERLKSTADIKLGMMVEVPAVALNADIFASEVDFFSIGTNDLVQYTLAVDRGNEKIADLYQSLDPAVLKLIKLSIDAAHKHDIPCAVCGEMASEHSAITILLGLGIDELSMPDVMIPSIRQFIAKHEMSKLKELSKKALQCSSQSEVLKLIKAVL